MKQLNTVVPPFSQGDMFLEPHWMPETTHGMFFPIHVYVFP